MGSMFGGTLTKKESDEDADLPVQRPRRMTSLEIGFREAVAPKTVPHGEETATDERGATLADLAFIDGTTSVVRLMRKMSTVMGLTSEKVELEEDDESMRPTPPPPPPPVPITNEVQAAIESAKVRRASVVGQSMRGDL